MWVAGASSACLVLLTAKSNCKAALHFACDSIFKWIFSFGFLIVLVVVIHVVFPHVVVVVVVVACTSAAVVVVVVVVAVVVAARYWFICCSCRFAACRICCSIFIALPPSAPLSLLLPPPSTLSAVAFHFISHSTLNLPASLLPPSLRHISIPFLIYFEQCITQFCSLFV